MTDQEVCEVAALKLAHVMGYEGIRWIKINPYRVGIQAYGAKGVETLAAIDQAYLSTDFGIDTVTVRNEDDLRYTAINLEMLAARLIGRMNDPSICSDFIQRFGLSLHDLYQEKYPINAETKIVDVRTDATEYQYIPPSKVDFAVAYRTISPLSINFEAWGYANSDKWAYLAYAPELNTVFVRQRKG